MEQANKECKTLSKMWRESGKQMPFKQFATLYNNGGLDAYYNNNPLQPKKAKGVSQDVMPKEVACPKKQSNATTYLQVAALVLIIAGTVYLVTKKSE
jgi:hypothetical protein